MQEAAFQDCYVLCFCQDCVPEEFVLWRDRFGADACYEVRWQPFLDEVSKVLKHSLDPRSLGGLPASNGTLNTKILARAPIPLLKPSRHAWQRESRAIWGPIQATGGIEPINIEVRDAREHARPFAVLNGDAIEHLAPPKDVEAAVAAGKNSTTQRSRPP